MTDIRKRSGKKGTTYQVRYPSRSAATGYAYKTFLTLKEARAFIESGRAQASSLKPNTQIISIADAADKWLRICEKEGLNGREPVTPYTLKNYEYRVSFIKAYDWPKPLFDLTPPDVVGFRSWLLQGAASRVVASKVLSTLHSILKEMTIRGIVPHNAAAGICVRTESRYQEPAVIPSRQDIVALLSAADRLANSKNLTIAKAWERYRPILYLAADSGMRPQEYLALSHKALTDTGVQVDRAIDGSGRSITVTKTSSGRRFIELSAETLSLIRRYAAHHSLPNDYDLVFPAKNGRWMCRRNWQRRGFNAACMEAGLVERFVDGGETIIRPKFTPYDLRHFFASMHIEKGTNLKKLQTLMGHSNIETTLNVYGHLLEEKEDAKIRVEGMLSALLEKTCGESVAINP